MKLIDQPDPLEVAASLWANFGVHEMGYDVGANIGQSVAPMLDFCERVVSFEPNKQSFEVLEQTWRRHENVQTFRVAVSHRDGTVMLAQLAGKQAETGQLVTPGLEGMEWDPGDWAGVPQVQCWSRSLDSLATDYGHPTFVKIDTEGHEVMVLMGAPGLLQAQRTSWLIEFHSPDNYSRCIELLAAYGHHIETIRHPHYPVRSPMWYQHGWIKAFAPSREREPNA